MQYGYLNFSTIDVLSGKYWEQNEKILSLRHGTYAHIVFVYR
jgi:hypothetical protein